MPSRARVAFIRLTHRLAGMAVQTAARRCEAFYNPARNGGSNGSSEGTRATLDWRHDLLSEVERVILRPHFCILGRFHDGRGCCGRRRRMDYGRGRFDGVANLAAKSLIATDISGEVTFHRLLDTTPQDFLMLPHARTSKWTKGLGAIAELDGVRGWRRSPRQ